MISLKGIERIIPKPTSYNMVGDGFRVYNYLPGDLQLRERMSPFLMLDFNSEYNFGPSNAPRGVGVHPHKGFETVTIAYKGHIAHHDSMGNSGIIDPGEVQWMTAGAGILHKEYHEEKFSKVGGPFEMVQLWVNLPAAHKLTPPSYQSITNEKMAIKLLPNLGGEVRVIAGNYKEIKGSAKTFSPIELYDLRLNPGAELSFDLPEEQNTAVLVIRGEVRINNEEIRNHELVLFSHKGETIHISTDQNAVILLMSGSPINEPIVQYGPFVMNSMKEIHEAIDEFNSGKFGSLD